MIRYLATVILSATGAVLAQSGADSSKALPVTDNPESISMGWLLFKTMGVLVLIIALIFVLVYLLKKFVFNPSHSGKESGWIQVLGQTQIQPKKSFALIKVLDRVLLVGLTDSSMETLTEFNDLSKVQPYLERMKTSPQSWKDNRFLGMIKKNLES